MAGKTFCVPMRNFKGIAMLEEKEEREKRHTLETQQAFTEGYRKGLGEVDKSLHDLVFSWSIESTYSENLIESDILKKCSDKLNQVLFKNKIIDASKALDGLDAEIPNKTESVQTWLAQLREVLERKK